MIETEIKQMKKQKLLVEENDRVSLSDLSKKILMVSHCVKTLNNEHKKVCINLVSGDIEGYDAETVRESKEAADICLLPKISEENIDGISVEENVSFFSSYMDTFRELDEIQIESVLESVYAEFDIVGKGKGYKACQVSFLPCAIHEEEREPVLNSENDDAVCAKGQLCKICYSVRSEIAALYEDILPSLMRVARTDAEMLSERGMDVVEKYREFKEYEKKDLICYFDLVSGFYQFQQPPECGEKRGKPNMELPVRHTVSPEFKEFFIERLREEFSIPDDLIIYEKSCMNETYFVECSLRSLRGGCG